MMSSPVQLRATRRESVAASAAHLICAATLCLFFGLPLVATAEDPAYEAKEVYRSANRTVSVESLGKGVYLFRWWPGLYVSPFLVTDEETVVIDPISDRVAELYGAAVRAVTDRPITTIIYSHDHLDHIGGARIIAPDADIYAHAGVADFLRQRGENDVLLPTRQLSNGDVLQFGDRTIRAHYFGPCHGDFNVALEFETDLGSLLVLVDTIEIGIAPYRSLPDTNFNGYLVTLAKAAALEPDWVLGGHSGPGSGRWLNRFHGYFLDMKKALAEADQAIVEIPAADGEDFIVASERHIDKVVDYAVNALRPKYGHWRGFEQWAPMNAQTIRMAITIGK